MRVYVCACVRMCVCVVCVSFHAHVQPGRGGVGGEGKERVIGRVEGQGWHRTPAEGRVCSRKEL